MIDQEHNIDYARERRKGQNEPRQPLVLALRQSNWQQRNKDCGHCEECKHPDKPKKRKEYFVAIHFILLIKAHKYVYQQHRMPSLSGTVLHLAVTQHCTSSSGCALALLLLAFLQCRAELDVQAMKLRLLVEHLADRVLASSAASQTLSS
tara:strand:- start:109 stop:558 length:450 start_codon:yes stop_codon:yes gene_type:complete